MAKPGEEWNAEDKERIQAIAAYCNHKCSRDLFKIESCQFEGCPFFSRYLNLKGDCLKTHEEISKAEM